MKSRQTILSRLRSLSGSERRILAICVSISFILWLFTKFSYPYRSTIKVGLDYNLPMGKTYSKALPDAIELDIEASGWELLGFYLQFKKFNIDLEFENNEPKIINSISLKAKLQKNLSPDVKIIEFRPDQIEYVPDDKIEKWIPVLLKSNLQLADEYMLKDSILIEPKIVKMIGPATVLEKIDYWETEILQLDHVQNNFRHAVQLKSHALKNIDFQPNRIEAIGKVEQITEKKIEVEIQKRNVPDSLQLILLPNKIDLLCLVGISDYELIQADQFVVVADFDKIVKSKENKIRLELKDYPEYILKVNLTSKETDFIIRKK